eukprot:scaffold6789_cov115-Isochrysis_galbana.AAC.6
MHPAVSPQPVLGVGVRENGAVLAGRRGAVVQQLDKQLGVQHAQSVRRDTARAIRCRAGVRSAGLGQDAYYMNARHGTKPYLELAQCRRWVV